MRNSVIFSVPAATHSPVSARLSPIQPLPPFSSMSTAHLPPQALDQRHQLHHRRLRIPVPATAPPPAASLSAIAASLFLLPQSQRIKSSESRCPPPQHHHRRSPTPQPPATLPCSACSIHTSPSTDQGGLPCSLILQAPLFRAPASQRFPASSPFQLLHSNSATSSPTARPLFIIFLIAIAGPCYSSSSSHKSPPPSSSPLQIQPQCRPLPPPPLITVETGRSEIRRCKRGRRSAPKESSSKRGIPTPQQHIPTPRRSPSRRSSQTKPSKFLQHILSKSTEAPIKQLGTRFQPKFQKQRGSNLQDFKISFRPS